MTGRPIITGDITDVITDAKTCPTWVQTCVYLWDGEPLDTAERDAYLAALRLAASRGPLRGVQLYTVARPSLQPERERVGPVDAAFLRTLARRIEAAGIPVTVASG